MNEVKFYSLAMFAMRFEGEDFVLFVDSSVRSAYSKEEAEQIATRKIEEKCKAAEGWENHLVSAREFTVERRHFTADPNSSAKALVM